MAGQDRAPAVAAAKASEALRSYEFRVPWTGGLPGAKQMQWARGDTVQLREAVALPLVYRGVLRELKGDAPGKASGPETYPNK